MIHVRVFNAHPRYRLARKPVEQYVRSVMKSERRTKADVSVVFIDSRHCRNLNRQYLHHDYSTDVISFPLPDVSRLEGEVYVNLDRARQQARSYRVSFSNEVARLVIHGALHLAGYEDEGRAARRKMRHRENRYLKHWFADGSVKE